MDIVRRMIDHDTAWAVMGNHEYNALLWHTTDERGEWLRRHNTVHRNQHAATLREYQDSPRQLRDLLDWIVTLPLFLEHELFRVVHAAWDESAVNEIRHAPRAPAEDTFLQRSAVAGFRESEIVEYLLKGVEIPIPHGYGYLDKEGTPRHKTRTRWWLDSDEQNRLLHEHQAITLGMVAMPPADRDLAHVPVDRSLLTHLPGYTDPRPVFIGHYWLTGTPSPLTPRIACMDYSIAHNGSLCAYRFDGELPLTADRFVCVNAG